MLNWLLKLKNIKYYKNCAINFWIYTFNLCWSPHLGQKSRFLKIITRNCKIFNKNYKKRIVLAFHKLKIQDETTLLVEIPNINSIFKIKGSQF